MKILHNLLHTVFLCIAVLQFSYAQSKEQTITSLKEIFSDYEIKELSPCNIHIIERVQDVVYLEYKFAPNDAVWEGKRSGVFADWKVVMKNRTANSEEATKSFYFMLHNDDIEFHQRTANLLNNLAEFCNEPPKTNRDNVSDNDLVIFYFDYTNLQSEIEKNTEIFEQSLEEFSTPLEKLVENYKLVEKNTGYTNLTLQEEKDYQKTKNIIKEYNEKVANGFNFFDQGTSGLPKNQFETYFEKLNNDPEFLKRLENALKDF